MQLVKFTSIVTRWLTSSLRWRSGLENHTHHDHCCDGDFPVSLEICDSTARHWLQTTGSPVTSGSSTSNWPRDRSITLPSHLARLSRTASTFLTLSASLGGGFEGQFSLSRDDFFRRELKSLFSLLSFETTPPFAVGTAATYTHNKLVVS